VAGVVGSITGSLIPALGEAVTAAAEEEEQVATLATVLRNNLKGATDDAIAAQIDLISSWQIGSTFADDELRPAYGRLVTATQNAAAAQDLLRVAMDVAAATGKPLSAVTEALAKAQGGSYGALRKLIPTLDTATAKELGMAGITLLLKDRFGGADRAASKTAKGSLQDLDDVFGDLQESLGTQLLPTLKRFTEWAGTKSGQDAIAAMGRAFEALGSGLASAADAYDRLSSAWNSLPEELRNLILNGWGGGWQGLLPPGLRPDSTTYGPGARAAGVDVGPAYPAARRTVSAAPAFVVNVSGALDAESTARQLRAIVNGHARRTGSTGRGRAW
jgi:hypothetical protein